MAARVVGWVGGMRRCRRECALHPAGQQEGADDRGPGAEAAEQQAARDRCTGQDGGLLTDRMQDCTFPVDYG